MSDPWEPIDEQPGAHLRPDEHEKQALLDGRSTRVDRAPTLGEMAEVLLDWQERGVGLASLQYATGQVFWRELSAAEEVAEQVRTIRAEYRAAYLGGARDEHHPDL